jgi:hypothetical protein
MLPLDQVYADGARAYDLDFLALAPDGSPLTGIELSIGARDQAGRHRRETLEGGKSGTVTKVSERAACSDHSPRSSPATTASVSRRMRSPPT